MSLATLPTELIDNITSHLDLASFRCLRLTSPSLNQQTLHPFKERFFEQFTLKWDLARFQTLLSISQHPYFGDALQHLYIDATPHFSATFWKLTKQLQDAERDNPSISISPERHQAAQKAADRRNQFWNQAPEDVNTLITIFQHAKNLRAITFAYDGLEKKYSQFARRYCENSQLEMSRPVVHTLRAIALSPFLHLSSFSICPTRKHGAVSIGRLETLSPLLSRFDDAFSRLTVLKMNLRDWRSREEGFEDPPGRVPFVVRFLAKCRGVRELEVSCFSGLEGDVVVGYMAEYCEWRELRSVKLGLFRVFDMDDLVKLLGKSRACLKHLVLEHVCLKDGRRDWADFLRALAGGRFAEGHPVARVDDASYGSSLVQVGGKGDVLPGKAFAGELRELAENVGRMGWGIPWFKAVVGYPFRNEWSPRDEL
jgi:hypothetical protein